MSMVGEPETTVPKALKGSKDRKKQKKAFEKERAA
jgi:hypothetical protein